MVPECLKNKYFSFSGFGFFPFFCYNHHKQCQKGRSMRVKNRGAFSLIELVFIIIISGVLASVALPRFIGITDDAHVSKLQAFAGTLNRSVGPTLWSGLLRREPNQMGKLATSSNFNKIRENAEVETIPVEFIGLGTPKVISLASCMESNNTVPSIGSPVGGLTAGKIAGTAEIGNTTYALGCIDGSLAGSPRFYLYDETKLVIVY
jgi:hypothetical protein